MRIELFSKLNDLCKMKKPYALDRIKNNETLCIDRQIEHIRQSAMQSLTGSDIEMKWKIAMDQALDKHKTLALSTPIQPQIPYNQEPENYESLVPMPYLDIRQVHTDFRMSEMVMKNLSKDI